MNEDEWANEVERLLGIRHGDMCFWREYHTNTYLHAAVTVVRRMSEEIDDLRIALLASDPGEPSW